MLLAPATQPAPPQGQQSLSEHRETVEVSWYRTVVEVSLHGRLEPFPRLSYRIVHASMKLLLTHESEMTLFTSAFRRVRKTVLDTADRYRDRDFLANTQNPGLAVND